MGKWNKKIEEERKKERQTDRQTERKNRAYTVTVIEYVDARTPHSI